MKRKVLNAGIVGLGQVGLLFDEDPKRKGIWTHFTAYETLYRDFNLISVCDTDSIRVKRAKMRRDVRGYQQLEEMLKKEKLDVVSICTPPKMHESQILQSAGNVRAILCEKPLGMDLVACQKAVRACKRTRTHLVVNYYKRYEATVQFVKREILKRRKLGRLTLTHGSYSGSFEAVGSHMVDLLRFFLGELKVSSSVKMDKQKDAYSASLRSPQNGLAHLAWTGKKENLIFEINLIGDKGRCRIFDNCERIGLELFRPSQRYSDYKELVPIPIKRHQITKNDRFLPFFEGVTRRLSYKKGKGLSDGEDALKTQKLMHDIIRKAR
jgi:UDP-N-acetyl-2-amino-2-deoxyglucuronate dehydrogenase